MNQLLNWYLAGLAEAVIYCCAELGLGAPDF